MSTPIVTRGGQARPGLDKAIQYIRLNVAAGKRWGASRAEAEWRGANHEASFPQWRVACGVWLCTSRLCYALSSWSRTVALAADVVDRADTRGNAQPIATPLLLVTPH